MNAIAHARRDIRAPAAAIFARISDHANTHTWVAPARVRLLEPGTPAPNGVGALREVSFPAKRLWTTIVERVLSFEPDVGFTYRIERGMPGLRDHLGRFTIAGGALEWHVEFDFKRWHPLGMIRGSFARTFEAVQREALDELARQLEA
ncbi:MAG: SRPBCC family protein [Kofleriaceae bacterium]